VLVKTIRPTPLRAAAMTAAVPATFTRSNSVSGTLPTCGHAQRGRVDDGVGSGEGFAERAAVEDVSDMANRRRRRKPVETDDLVFSAEAHDDGTADAPALPVTTIFMALGDPFHDSRATPETKAARSATYII
jgi:hypothetical protein